jgi:hypothetical protein
VSAELHVLRGDPADAVVGREHLLEPLDEDLVRRTLLALGRELEVEEQGDELVLAGDAILAEVLLTRDRRGVLRLVTAGFGTTGAHDERLEPELRAVATALLELARALDATLYREQLSDAGRVETADEVVGSIADAPPPVLDDSPPRLLVDFSELPIADAESYRRRYLEEQPERLRRFGRLVASTGGPAEEELDLSADSFDGVGRWLVELCRGRYGVLTGSPFMLPVAEWRRQFPGEPDGLPPWCAPGAERAPSPLPPMLLWIVDGLAAYLGECLIGEVEGLHWAVNDPPPRRRDVDEHETVVAGRGGFVLNPRRIAYGIALEAVAEHGQRVRELHDIWHDLAVEASQQA